MRVRTVVKKEEILRSAAEVFRELGFERASMAEIAARLGGAKATLYGYFESKEELFIAVAQAEAKAHLEPALEELSAADLQVAAALRRFGEKVLAFILQPEVVAGRRMVFAMAAHSSVGPTFYEGGPRRGVETLMRYFETAISAGKLRGSDTKVMAQHLMGLLESEFILPYLLSVESGVPPPAVIRKAVQRAVEVFLAAYEVRPRVSAVRK